MGLSAFFISCVSKLSRSFSLRLVVASPGHGAVFPALSTSDFRVVLVVVLVVVWWLCWQFYLWVVLFALSSCALCCRTTTTQLGHETMLKIEQAFWLTNLVHVVPGQCCLAMQSLFAKFFSVHLLSVSCLFWCLSYRYTLL
jgi:hypothetical protein